MSRRSGENTKIYLEALKTALEVGTLAKEIGIGAIAGSITGALAHVLPAGLPLRVAIVIGLLTFLIFVFGTVALRATTILTRYRAAERHFMTLAKLNVGADLQLFRQLFVRMNEILKKKDLSANDLDEILEAIEECIEATNTNIEDVLTQARVIMEEYSGYDCATCIKLHSKPDHVQTAARDAQSKAHRVVGEDQPIIGNTALVDTLILGKEMFGSNDLVKMGEEYENTRRGWKSLYNSSLVILIESPENTGNRLGCLCVDSLHGKLYNPV